MDINIRFCRDLTADDDQPQSYKRLAGHSPQFILTQHFIQNPIRDTITQFVGMTFCYGF